MKKLVVLLLVLVLGASLFASPLHFVFADLGQHPDMLSGFLPTYLLIGAGYDLNEIIEGNTTEVRLLFGDGFVQRLMWLDPDSGVNNFNNKVWDKDSALKFNVWQNDISLRFMQGFLSSPVKDKDLLLLTLTVNWKYEKYYSASKLGPFNIQGTYDKIIKSDYSGVIYPELNGKNDFMGIELAASLKLDMMEDTIFTNNGLWSKIELKVGPAALNKLGTGHASYVSVVFNTVGAKTLYNLKGSSDKTLFSVSLVDRVNGSYTTGDAVPSFIQGPSSLGRKVRGFNTYTFGTEFSVVNNFDIRLVGPGLGFDNIAPRLNIFFDCGYGWGKVFNTTRAEATFLASTGIQIDVCFFDVIDLGFEVNYLLVDKEKYTQSGRRITTNATFFLDF